MKGFRSVAAMFLAMVLVFAMPHAVFGDAIIDEDGNIIQENEELEGGIITLDVELDFDDDFFQIEVDVRGFASFSGQVVESQLEGFLSVQDADGNIVNFRINPYLTYFAHGVPEVGDFVIGFYNMDLPAPMIFPPQYEATAIVISEEAPPFFAVARFGLDHVSIDNMYRLSIGEDTEIFLQDGQLIEYVDGVLMIETVYVDEDGEIITTMYPVDTVRIMLVEYTISHRVIMPTTIFPERITVLFEPIMAFPVPIEDDGYMGVVTLPYELGDDELVPQLEEIDWGMYDVVVNLGDRNMGVVGATTLARDGSILPNYVSLAPFVRFLGGEVSWIHATRSVAFTNPNPLHPGQQVSIVIGQTGFTVNGVARNLSHAPVAVNGITYVHLSFFREALGFSNAYFAGGNVTIDNFERME